MHGDYSIIEHILSMHACLVAQSCLTLCDPMDCSLPGFSIHGILQTRIQEWVTMFSSRGSSPLRGSNLHILCLLHWQGCSLSLPPTGKPHAKYKNLNKYNFFLGGWRRFFYNNKWLVYVIETSLHRKWSQ